VAVVVGEVGSSLPAQTVAAADVAESTSGMCRQGDAGGVADLDGRETVNGVGE
jgi:hypothetical protein